jgi:hypothetical protein
VAPAAAAAPVAAPAAAAAPVAAPAAAPAAVDPALAAVPPQPAAASSPAASGTPEAGATASAQPKSDGGAAAAEMLALSEATLPPPDPASVTPPGSPGAQFQGAAPGAAAFGGAAQPGFGGAPFDRTGGAAGRRRGDEFGEFGGAKYRDGGGAPRDTKPVNYQDPHASVKAFLAALKDKDVDRLSEATALRSPYESSAKHRELFQKIVDGSISEAQLNDLADNLDEYTISGDAAVTSTGRRGVLVTKKTKTGKMQRKITVRKEKAGWKVLDISSIIEFKNFRRYTRQKSSQSSN